MSFSGNVREELAKNISPARHCRIAELAAFIGLCGTVVINRFDRCGIYSGRAAHLPVHDAPEPVAQRRRSPLLGHLPQHPLRRHEDALRILQATKMIGENSSSADDAHAVNPLIVQQICCRRAFLKGAFQASGSMSDPNKSYHFEIVCSSKEMAGQICDIMCGFGMDAKIVLRKKSFVVYLKEGSQIVDILNIMEAHVSLMALENVRILKEMRNTVNRKVNCETANINKTVSAAVKQVEDITYLRDTIGFDKMPEGLVEAALARLANPDATLKELGESLTPPVGKSGINHRLRKLSEMADRVRQEQGGLI